MAILLETLDRSGLARLGHGHQRLRTEARILPSKSAGAEIWVQTLKLLGFRLQVNLHELF